MSGCVAFTLSRYFLTPGDIIVPTVRPECWPCHTIIERYKDWLCSQADCDTEKAKNCNRIRSMYRVIKWITYQRTGYENTTNKPDKKRLKELWNETECNWPKNIKKTKTARKRRSCWKGACIMYLVWYIYIYIYDIYMTAATPTRERLEEGRMERREEKKGKSPKKHTHTRCSNSSKNLVYLVLIAFSLGYRVEPGTLPHLLLTCPSYSRRQLCQVWTVTVPLLQLSRPSSTNQPKPNEAM